MATYHGDSKTVQILKLLEQTQGMGITVKQISATLGVEPGQVESCLTTLRDQGVTVRKGRGLWVHNKYEDLRNVPGFRGPQDYVAEFTAEYGVPVVDEPEEINFASNTRQPVHRWSSYVQGFSSGFVNRTLDRYSVGNRSVVLDPMAGSGTVLVSAQMRGIRSVGVEMLPLMAFTARVKTNWDLDVSQIRDELDNLDWTGPLVQAAPPPFLQSDKQFTEPVLGNLLKLKDSISSVTNPAIRDLFRLAFVSILIDCSNLKRAPCLGYAPKKQVPTEAPFLYFTQKVDQMIADLECVHSLRAWGTSEVIQGDARDVRLGSDIDIAVTSPPYMSGMDYVSNYKIEMAWLDFVSDYGGLSVLKDSMIVCDNVSRGLIRRFSRRKDAYSSDWLDHIFDQLSEKMRIKKTYRRNDMHHVVRKYFDDLLPIFKNVKHSLREGGRFVIVIGDSLMATVYIPTDLLLAKLGHEIGFQIEEVRVARKRRSGQRTGFDLRESIVALRKT